MRKGVIVGQDLPLAGHIAVHQDGVRQEDFVKFYFEIYPHVIDMYIYHSLVYISSIFVNEKALTLPNEIFIVPYDVYIVG